MRDAIILSGWTWEANNVPERMAKVLAGAGARILYCENPVSVFRQAPRALTEISKNVFAFGLKFLGHRLNAFSVLSRIQAVFMANQITAYAEELKLQDPLLIYPHGDYCLSLCKEFKRRGFRLVNICMDYELSIMREHIRQADLALVIPYAAFVELKQEFGKKIRLIPQFSTVSTSRVSQRGGSSEPSDLSLIPRPRLGYFGELTGRVSLRLLGEILAKHSAWQFISFGKKKSLALHNEHVLSWRPQAELELVLDGLDVGFMPYDCSVPKNLHCVPLKLFDYFARGMPVVSTPIQYLRECEELVYLGDTADTLAESVSAALSEPADSPKKAKRKAIAQEHAVENLSRLLAPMLDELR